MRIEIYGRSVCQECENVVNFLEFNGIYYEYFNVEYLDQYELVELLVKRAPNTTKVPIIFIDGKKVENIDEFKDYFRNAGIIKD